MILVFSTKHSDRILSWSHEVTLVWRHESGCSLKFEFNLISNNSLIVNCHPLCTCRRNLDYFEHCHIKAVTSVDADLGNGELCVTLPPEVIPIIQGLCQFCYS